MTESPGNRRRAEKFRPRIAASITLSPDEVRRHLERNVDPINNEPKERFFEARLMEIAPDAFKVELAENGDGNGFYVDRASCPIYEAIHARLSLEYRRKAFLPGGEKNPDPEARARELAAKQKTRQLQELTRSVVQAATRDLEAIQSEASLNAIKNAVARPSTPVQKPNETNKKRRRSDGEPRYAAIKPETTPKGDRTRRRSLHEEKIQELIKHRMSATVGSQHENGEK